MRERERSCGKGWVYRIEKLGKGEAHELEKFRTGGRAKSLDAHMDSITDIFNAERTCPGMHFGVLIGTTVSHLSLVSF